MSAAAVLLAKLRQIMAALARSPRVGSHRNFCAQRRLAYTDAVDAFREQIIRNEFVVAVEIVIADIELNHTILEMSGSTHDIDRLDMMFVQLVECLTYRRILNDLSKRTRLQIT